MAEDLEAIADANPVTLGEVDALLHYGVKGMRWGKRKSGPSKVTMVDNDGNRTKVKVARGVKVSRNADGSLDLTSDSKRAIRKQNEIIRKAQEAKKPSSQEHDVARDLQARGTRTLTNAQLKAVNERLQLERSYAELTGQQTSVARGQKSVKNVLSIAGTAQQAYSLATSPMGRQVGRLFKDIFL